MLRRIMFESFKNALFEIFGKFIGSDCLVPAFDSLNFQPGILPESCKIMENYLGNPEFQPGNLGIQETYQEIQG